MSDVPSRFRLLSCWLAALAAAVAVPAATIDPPVSPNAQPGVASTLQFFANISGRYVVAGQQEFPGWPDELSSDPAGKDVDFNYIRETTGKTPGLRGFDFLFYTHSAGGRAVQHSTERAIAWAQQGGLVAFCCHMFMQIGSPADNPQFYTPGASTSAAGTTYDIRQAVIEGTPENLEFIQKMDLVAAELKKLRDANVPVIWRPFHECSGGWFWWGAHGPEPLKKAWRMMFDRFTKTHGLTNLIWCFNPTDAVSTNLPLWYPGDDVVDLVSIDIYPTFHDTRGADFRFMRDFTHGRKPVVMSENGMIPDPDVMFDTTTNAAGWGYFCTWNGFENDPARNTAAFLTTVYNHPRVITLDELPALFAANSLAITTAPTSQRVTAGSALNLSVGTNGGDTLTYQWAKDGTAIPGATSATYTVPTVTAAAAGRYTVTVSSSAAAATSEPAEVAVSPAGGTLPVLYNISARAQCSTGDRVAIGGFVIAGSVAKRYLVRAVGPSLTSQGLATSEVLADPLIEVHHGAGIIGENDNWTSNANAAEITATATRVGAQQLLGSDTQSAALLVTLQPGVYSFIAKGREGASGIVLLEVYDADNADQQASFYDIATRAYSTGGNGVTIGGFVITGSAPKRVLMQAVGPTLVTQGIGAADVLNDPTIELHRGSPTIAANDDWLTNANAAEIRATRARLGATPLMSGDTTSAALLMYLEPGAYSFIARGKNDSSGIVLVEVYNAD